MRSCRESVTSESEEKRKMPILNDGQKEKYDKEKDKGDVFRRKKGVREDRRIQLQEFL